MKYLESVFYLAGLMVAVRAQDECVGISQNGLCCPYGVFSNGECCPYGNILGTDCCMSYEASQGQSWGNIITGSGQSCPSDAIAIPMDSPSYSSLLTSAASQLGITTIPASGSTAIDASLTATAVITSASVSESTTATAAASETGVTSSASTSPQGHATSAVSSSSTSSSPDSTSTGAGAQITAAAIPVGLIMGMCAYLI